MDDLDGVPCTRNSLKISQMRSEGRMLMGQDIAGNQSEPFVNVEVWE